MWNPWQEPLGEPGEKEGLAEAGEGDLVAEAMRDAADEAVDAQPPQAVGGHPGGAWNFAADTPERYLVRFKDYDKLSLEYMNERDAVTKPGKPEDVEEQLPEWLR